jgi:hypothetical protein
MASCLIEAAKKDYCCVKISLSWKSLDFFVKIDLHTLKFCTVYRYQTEYCFKFVANRMQILSRPMAYRVPVIGLHGNKQFHTTLKRRGKRFHYVSVILELVEKNLEVENLVTVFSLCLLFYKLTFICNYLKFFPLIVGTFRVMRDWKISCWVQIGKK